MTTTETAEARALARLAFEELGLAARGVGGMHQAIAARAFGVAGPAARPARTLHDLIASVVYASLHGGARALGRAAEATLSRRDLRALSQTPRGAAVLAVINGLRGDELAAEGHPLALAMAVRAGGRPVALTRPALAEAFPSASGRVAVFLHGLFGTEHQWRPAGREGYGERLAREHGWTPVELRYNTGRAIDDNGAELARLLEQLVDAWPVPVTSLALVGHSMGGLVARSACHQAGDRRWKELLGHSVTLGTPHTGSSVAQAVELATGALGLAPETRTLANFFSRRSAGIRDLERGLSHPPLETARHHYVSAGADLLVRRASAVPADAPDVLHLPGVGHMALLGHDAVYERLRDWLEA